MIEGTIKITQEPGTDTYYVVSDVIDGNSRIVGTLRRERDDSVAAKRRSAAAYVWFAHVAGSNGQLRSLLAAQPQTHWFKQRR
jgi:hypothetical protein